MVSKAQWFFPTVYLGTNNTLCLEMYVRPSFLKFRSFEKFILKSYTSNFPKQKYIINLYLIATYETKHQENIHCFQVELEGL